MLTETIQCNYELLDKVAAVFAYYTDCIEQLYKVAQRHVEKLEQGAWLGRGAVIFYKEMSDEILPALGRMAQSYQHARDSVQRIAQVFKQAEEQAGRLFMGSAVVLASTGGNAPDIVKVSEMLHSASAEIDSGPTESGPFRIGPPTRPNIYHDNGFLDVHEPRRPTLSDYAMYAMWNAILRGAEVFRPDLADATAAYRHFLYGNGADRTFSYERFVANDPAGRDILTNLIAEAQEHAEKLSQGRTHFSMTSEAYAIGGGDPRFRYPETENWQKAIGAHNVWTSAEVVVSGESPNHTYTMVMTLHAEDRYNFNPKATDIATGIPDDANGIFEITGLARQYMNYSTLTRTVTWREGDPSSSVITAPSDSLPTRESQ